MSSPQTPAQQALIYAKQIRDGVEWRLSQTPDVGDGMRDPLLKELAEADNLIAALRAAVSPQAQEIEIDDLLDAYGRVQWDHEPLAVRSRKRQDVIDAVAQLRAAVVPQEAVNKALLSRCLRLVLLGLEGWSRDELAEAQAIHDEIQGHLVAAIAKEETDGHRAR